ncbi:MAG: hypothetical protein GWO36_17755, partial [Gemmatimonadetes bacterium]|nr:hypothetical protein [Gemmatimonadota bacterium]NIX40896.1 hypothetical protein [Gemmatimonadota bacterium]
MEMDVVVRSDNSLDGVIRSDRREAILIDGTDGSPRFRRPDGRALSQTDIYALEEIWIGL